MVTFEEARDLLDAIIEALPQAIFQELNGGVILSREAPLHPEDVDGTLRVMGRYTYEPAGLGRYVTIYYGSFERLYGGRRPEFWRRRLKEVLHHELVHHLESLAGDRSLELEDARDIKRYRGRKGID